MMNKRFRNYKTVSVLFEIQCYVLHGWELTTFHTNHNHARRLLANYRETQPQHMFRLKASKAVGYFA